jgi:hypothetical protein
MRLFKSRSSRQQAPQGPRSHSSNNGGLPTSNFRVRVPESVRPGEEFQVYAGDQIVRVRCPMDSRPGQSLQITVPSDNNSNNTPTNDNNNNRSASDSISMPPGSRRSNGNGTNNNYNNNYGMESRTSNGVGNSSTSFPSNPQTPLSSEFRNTNNNSANVRTITGSEPPAYMVSIPDGIFDGQQFPVTIRGQQLIVTCPPNASPGVSVRIVPPPLPEDRSVPSPQDEPRLYQRNNSTNSAETEGLPTYDLRQNGTGEESGGLSEQQQLQQQQQQQQQRQQQQQQSSEREKTQLFEVEVPQGVQPGVPFALLAGGVRVLVTCPSNAGPGKRIRFKLPRALTQQQVGNDANSRQSPPNEMQQIKLSYDKDGWTRTLTWPEYKFRWIRMDGKGDIDADVMSGHRRFHMDKSAYVRRLEFKLGEDPRIRTGLLSLVPATESVVDSKIKAADGRDLVTYGDLSRAQMKSFDEKTDWFQETCAKLCVEWNEGHMRMNIRRQYLLGDSVDAVMSLSRKDLRKLWRFEFIGEMGIDAGGLAREWFELVCQEIFDPDTGLWTSSATNQMSMTINPASGEFCVAFRFVCSKQTILIVLCCCVVVGVLVDGWIAFGVFLFFWAIFWTFSLMIFIFQKFLYFAITQKHPYPNRFRETEFCCGDHLIYYRFLGRVMGKAMFDRQLIKGHMVKHLYKHILGWPIYFKDLESVDEEYYNNLKQLRTMHENGEDISMLCLDFTMTSEIMGIRKEVELVEGGADIEVTNENFPEYVEACLKYKLMGSVKPQLNELLLGFFDVIPEPLLTIFDYQELELIMCGLPHIDLDDWKAHTEYSGEYEEFGIHHPTVEWFWDTLEEFNDEMKARLLLFVTGTSGVPSRGFGVLQSNDGNVRNFTIHGVSAEICFYPRAHTCFNRIDLPIYDSKEKLQERLKLAVTMSATGFDIE